MQNEWDYIIIGSGSAGSALAYRLGESGKHRILVLEFGGSDIGPFIQMPSALSYPMNMSWYDWGYEAEAEESLGGRRLVCPRGKVIGGSSSINGMIYVRGHAEDYEHWEASGAHGWSYADVLPYFRRMETAHIGEADSAHRGKSGPLHITRGKRDNPLHDAFVRAAIDAGYTETNDYNGYRQEGFGAADMTVWRGRRWSAANAYLRPALKRGNVSLIKRALVDKVLFEGKRAVGVRYLRGGKVCEARVRYEVICSAGAINSPQILQRSGVGSASLLKKHGIGVVADRKGVGSNLQDHLEVYFQMACLQPITLYKYIGWHWKGLIGLRWLLTKGGLGASNHFETLGFIRSDAGVRYPDIQFHFLPLAVRYDGKSVLDGHAFQLHVGPMRSESRGHVRLRSARPEEAPEINFNYMSKDQDWIDFRKCIRLTREILSQPAMDAYRGKELSPGAEVQSDEALDDFIKNHAESAYHPCGTARMGSEADPLSVVDSECRVIGVEGLRVADSSVFPRITNGNLNAPSIMVGEKASDHILGREALQRSNAPYFEHSDWEAKQR